MRKYYRMRKSKDASKRPVRKDDIIALGFDVILLIVALLPLFSIKQVFFPVNEEEKEKYESLGVKIPFGILCGLSIVVSIMIMGITRTFIVNLMGNNDPGGFSGASFMMMIPCTMMLYLMLPLYIVYRMHVK